MKLLKRTKNRKLRIYHIVVFFLIIFTICLFTFDTSFSRYVYNGIKDYFFESKSFFFNCDKMDTNTAIFQLDNWDGVTSFPITFHMNSFKNNMIAATSNIGYDITYNCSVLATCTISKQTGVISADTNTDEFTITVNPNGNLAEGDRIVVTVSAESSYPYVKTISGRITLTVGIPGLAYEIVDKTNQPYLNFSITNTLEYYQVVTAFGNYAVGAHLDANAYNALSDTDKAKCTSAKIRLDFDPNVVLLDMTSDFYENAYSYTTTTIGGQDYINSVTFGMDVVSSMIVRFYKANASANYTYPYANITPIIQFNVL